MHASPFSYIEACKPPQKSEMHAFIWEKKASFYKLIIYNTLYRAVWRAVEIQAGIRHPGIKNYGKGGFDPWRLYRCVVGTWNPLGIHSETLSRTESA
jgi:hypothetical protein